ncbi:MAG: class I SAM-dependent methyltransferase [Nitriliruptoraceae bacterium]|nr:class I SAM-dependent methyltransferase [Nitriliruptoraceae bacterium]
MDDTVLEQVRTLIAPEPPATARARTRAGALAPPAPEIGALLRWAALTVGARQIVEVGSAGGVTALWLLEALPDRGVVTSIEPDPHAHGLATDALAEHEDGSRVRAILGAPATVLPRLSDGAYDLVLLQARPAARDEDLDHVRRLLRPGGMLLVRGVLRAGEHGDAHARFLSALAEDPAFTATVLPVDDGLVVATRREDPTD